MRYTSFVEIHRSRHALPIVALLLVSWFMGCAGSPAPVATFSLSASALSFSSVYGQAIATQTVTLTNTGQIASPVSSITLSAPFSTSATAAGCGTLAPAATCILPITYGTGAIGATSGSLTVTYGSSSVTATLNAAVKPSTYTLSATALSYTKAGAAQTITLTNTVPGAAVTVSSVILSGTNSSAFLLSASTCNGDITSSCSVSVVFNPAASGSQSASLLFNTNGAVPVVYGSTNGSSDR